MTGPSPSFGALLKHYRTSAGLTQEELAERSGLSARGISDLERGARERPHRDTLDLLIQALDLDTDQRATLVRAARPLVPTSSSPDSTQPPNNLPRPMTSLIGRANDVDTLVDLLRRGSVRLLTLTGPGGVGKTRLAVQVASGASSSFRDGVCFVSLAALRDPRIVEATIVNAFGLTESTQEPAVERIRVHLAQKRVLLVIDNFEHLLDAVPVVNELLSCCPGLTVLATSRTLLRLSGEHVYAVAPLSLPGEQDATDLERVFQSPAASLFIERRSSVIPLVALTNRDAPVIAAICKRLDGLPLAIELAAARSRHLSLIELSERLQHRLPLLTAGPRDLPDRQQTLRSAIGWSYDLLTDNQQRLLRWLSVFVGGWTLTAAEELVAGMSDDQREVVPDLGDLVDSSLIRVVVSETGATRYQMLETIREFAEEQLIESGERDAAARQQALVMQSFSERAERGLQSGERTSWSRASVDELDNVRAALRWALDHAELELALSIVGNLDWFWDAVARDREGWYWCLVALDQPGIDQHGLAYARALSTAGAIAWNIGDFTRSADLLIKSVNLLSQLSDKRSLGQALANLGLTQLYLGDVHSARQSLLQAVALFGAVGDPWGLAMAQFALGEVLARSDLDAARASYDKSLDLFRSIGEPWGMAHAIAGLGGVAMRNHEFERARQLMEEALEIRRSIGNKGAIAVSATSLGELARRMGALDQSEELLREGLDRFRDLADGEHVAWTLYNLGLVALRRGHVDDAANALGECLQLRTAQGNALEIAKTLGAVAHLARLRCDDVRAAQLWGTIQALRGASVMEAAPTDEMDRECDEIDLLRAALGGPEAERELMSGRQRTLDDALHLAHQVLGIAGRRD